MSLEIITGDSGAGKTTRLLQEIIEHAEHHPDKSHLLLVPEQFCLSAQQKLADMHPRHTLLNIEALSFDRLAARCFRELRVDTAGIISETSKSMLLSLAVRDCKGKLSVYEKQSAYPAFIRRLSSLFAEWTMNDLEPERIRALSEEESLGQLLRLKLKDLSLLWEAFRLRLGDRQTAEEMLPLFNRLLPRSAAGKTDYLYLDGYTGFTSVQYRIIEQLLRRCESCRVVLTLPPEEETGGDDPRNLFFLSSQTVQRLEKTAREAGRLSRVTRWPAAFSGKPDLEHLRKHLFRHTPAEGNPVPGESVHLAACTTPEEEAAMAAWLVRHLVQEEGLRYRDIAITVSDQKLYLPLLKRELKDKKIPYFSDRREPLRYHPLICLVTDVLEAVSEGFPRERLLKLLKNPLSPLSREECDAFENYLLASGTRSWKDLQEPFSRCRKRRAGESSTLYRERAESEREEAEGLRQRITEALRRLKEGLPRGFTAKEGCMAIRRFLIDWGLGEKLPALEEEFRALEEDGPSWSEALKQLDGFFMNMEAILGETVLSRREFKDLTGAALEGLACGRLPISPDQLVIGDILRSRLGDIKSLIFLGMNEGLVPKTRSESRLLTDHDRIALSLLEEDLGYTDQRAMGEERFYLYCLLQKPVESLYISYAQRGAGDGRERLPAFTLQEIKKLLPSLTPAYFSRETGFAEMRDAGLTPVRLSEESVESLFGKTLKSSVSALQSFVSCPFRFFLQQGLGLEKRQEWEWAGADHGNLFHKIAELMLRRIKEDEISLEELSPEGKKKLVADSIEKAVGSVGLPGEKDSPPVLYSLRRWQRFFETYLDYLREEGLKDGFVPEAFEVDFGRDEYKEIGYIPLSRGRGLQLKGVLDRVDIKRQEEGDYLRVVDYKTYKSAAFSPAELVEGKQLQLPLYLDMILRRYQQMEPDRVFKPGGIGYESLAEQLAEWKARPEESRKELWKLLGLNGITAQEAAGTEMKKDGTASAKSGAGVKSARLLELTAAFARDKARQLGEAVLEGDMTPAPWEEGNQSTSCGYCDMQRACAFQENKPGCRYRKLSLGRDQAWAIISRGEEEKEESREVQ